jgi:flavin reductase (DIM6/NTAB) family NADH-FMN oxidoreductase RutF
VEEVVMLKVVAEDAGKFFQHYPRAATIVTANHEGRKNAMAVAWHCSLSFEPPRYGIAVSPKRSTYNMIIEGGQFGINFMPYDTATKVAAVGGSSGLLTDKFTEFGLMEDSALKLDVPILKDAYAAYECKVIDTHVFGDHAWIVGDILAVHVDESLLMDSGILDMNAVLPALYLGGETYCTVDAASVRLLDRAKYGTK